MSPLIIIVRARTGVADMEYTYLGDTGFEVSQLCLDCISFGSDAERMVSDRQMSLDFLSSALDAGVSSLDMANAYSCGGSGGIVSGATIGRDREKLAVATKVYLPIGGGPNKSRLLCKHIINQAHTSLDRLGADYIDPYQVHRWDNSVLIEEALSALDHLAEEGLVRYVGVSTMSSYQFMKVLCATDVESLERLACM